MKAPPIEDLLPEMIKIAEEGQIVERLARFLLSKGYTSDDLWREIKKLIAVSEVHTMALRSAFGDLEKAGHTYAFSPVEGLRATLTLARRRKKVVKDMSNLAKKMTG